MRYLDETVLANGVEELFGFRLSSGTCIADVVASFLAYLSAIQSLRQATMEAVRLRLRPIIMTSLAFILGVLPLAFSQGAGAAARQTIGWTVLGGMLAATLLAIFVVPVLFTTIGKVAYGRKDLEETGEVEG